MTELEGGVLEPEDYDHDNDSALGDHSLTDSTASISSSILKYREENGRTYHAYKDGKYVLPNDETEKDRLDLQHHLFTSLTFDGKLFTCPLAQKKQIHRVLDVGTGTGIWAIDFGDEYPEAQVLGVDLSPIQPLFVSPNVKFEIDDLEEPWTFTYQFDFIYSRMMTASFKNWPKFFEQSLKSLTPGGFIELADICFPIETDDNSLSADSPLKKFCDLILEGTTKFGAPMDSAKSYKTQLEDAGFINVVEVIYKWPQTHWPKSKKYKEIGLWQQENSISGLEACMAIFTRALGWSKEEVDVFFVDVRKDIKNTRIHGYWPVYVVYGQKPL